MVALVITGALLVSACGADARQGYGLADAEAAGIIMPLDALDGAAGGNVPEIIEASERDITTGTVLTAQLVFPIARHLNFQGQDGEVTLIAENGQHVNEGDVLALLISEADDRLEIAYLAASRRLEQFEANFDREHRARSAEIRQARERMAALDGNARRQAALELELLRIGLERFVYTSTATREAIRDEVIALSEMLDGEEIAAPFDGMVVSIDSGPYALRWNPRIMTIADPNTFFYQITLSADQTQSNRYNIMGLGDIITLRSTERHMSGGVERPILEFDARVVTDSWAGGIRERFTYWLVPVDMEGLLETVRALDTGNPDNPLYTLFGLSFTAQIEIVLATNSVTLPLAAVHEEDRRSFVYIYNDGGLGKRYVQTGFTVGGYVQIISGLEAGAKVVILP
jgi:multidrug efflux pump subunit AcrA (membrane-fusion protein)